MTHTEVRAYFKAASLDAAELVLEAVQGIVAERQSKREEQGRNLAKARKARKPKGAKAAERAAQAQPAGTATAGQTQPAAGHAGPGRPRHTHTAQAAQPDGAEVTA